MMLQRTTIAVDRLDAAVARLTPKERECLERWLSHATAKEIALDLGITHHAVEKRLKSARAKLGVTSTLDAARLLAAAPSYGPTVSHSPEVASDQVAGQAPDIDPPAVPRVRRNLVRIAAGVSVMSIIALSALLLAGAQAPGTAPQPAAAAAPRVFTVTRSANQKAELESALQAAFSALDRNNDGTIGGTELTAARFRVLRMDGAGSGAKPEADGLLGLDADKDGRVTRDEFLAGMTAMSRRPATGG
ncbi:EF-hand domain-containing protein [Sphingomonas humi]|uniref:Histidine kinase n=1 Tax=Sphingomonas humi TaxID=335630 RepID=A0ABP7RWC4_9SPHN